MIGAKTKLKIAQRNKRLAIKSKVFHGNESGARQGSSCKNISNSLADVLNDENERQQSNYVSDYNLYDSESIHSSEVTLGTSVLKQDTSSDGNNGLCDNK